jgi:hypothetical protein
MIPRIARSITDTREAPIPDMVQRYQNAKKDGSVTQSLETTHSEAPVGLHNSLDQLENILTHE